MGLHIFANIYADYVDECRETHLANDIRETRDLEAGEGDPACNGTWSQKPGPPGHMWGRPRVP